MQKNIDKVKNQPREHMPPGMCLPIKCKCILTLAQPEGWRQSSGQKFKAARLNEQMADALAVEDDEGRGKLR